MNCKIFIWICCSIFATISCNHEYNNSISLKNEYQKLSREKLDPLTTIFMSCTECLDLYIESGKLTIQDKFKNYPISEFTDLKICGNFPMDFIDINSFNYQSDTKFIITGKIIRLDSTNAIGLVPVFYIEKWKKEKYYPKKIKEITPDSI